MSQVESQPDYAEGNDLAGEIMSIARMCFRTKQDFTLADNMDSIEGWDSLAHIQLVLKLEKAFQMRFSTNQIIGLTSLEQALYLVESAAKLSSQNAAARAAINGH
jgi:acyl carrier protein